jgi:hypothetical protein
MPRIVFILIACFILLPQIRTATSMGQWTPLLIDLALLVTAYFVLRFVGRQIAKRVLRPIGKVVKMALSFLFLPRNRRYAIDEDDITDQPVAAAPDAKPKSGGRASDDTAEFAPIY